jgi:hypothetical protein
MLRNYAHHAQSPKFLVYSVHKMQGKAIWQTIKKLSDRSYFVEPRLQSHVCEGHADRPFFHGRTINTVYMTSMIAIIGVDQLCAQRKPIGGPIGSRIGRIRPICARDCACHAHMQTDQVNFCACTCAHMHKTDLPTTPNKRRARYFIDTDETRFLRRTVF